MRAWGLLAVLLAALTVAGACGGDDDDSETASQEQEATRTEDDRVTPVARPGGFTFTNGDGQLLTGEVYDGGGETAVLLASMSRNDQRAWRPFAQDLRDAGYRAYTFDYRGYGRSEGERETATFDDDLAAALEYVAAQEGVERVVIVGASAGGTAALAVAAAPPEDIEIAGVLTLSAPREFEGLAAGTAGAEGLPVVLLAAEDDDDAAQSAAALAEIFDGEAVVYEGRGHGTDMLRGRTGAEVSARIVEFIESVQ